MLELFHPTDLTEQSEVAFAHALRIAMAGDARLTSLHVRTPDEGAYWESFPSERAVLERWGYLDPGSTRDDVRALGVEVDKVEAGSFHPVRAILSFLSEHPTDLIVLATHARKGFHRWFEGSIAETVTRVAQTMSLFVPHGVPGFVDMQTGNVSLDSILVPVAQKPDGTRAVAAARSLATALGVPDARVRACYVGDPKDAPLLDDNLAMIIRPGSVTDGLCKAVEEVKADLVVVTTEGHHGILDALRGSTAEQVLRRCGRPLLAVPAS